jgi:MYXO-CTERM domain-containing protein
VAWKNTAAGFYANHSSGGNTWYNNTAWSNGSAYNMLASPPGDSSATITLTGDKAHVMRNNVGFPNKNANMGGVDTANNTWDSSLTPTNDDFVSTSDADCRGARLADGGLPATQFLHLKAGSPLIDEGQDVKLPFVGSAPDLGAYEYGAPDPSTGSAGNRPGTGGSGVAGSAGGDEGGAAGANAGGTAPSRGGSSASIAGASSSAAGTTPGGAPPGGGGTSPASSAGTNNAPASPEDTTAGCACRVGGEASRNHHGAAVAMLLSLLAARRRRR